MLPATYKTFDLMVLLEYFSPDFLNKEHMRKHKTSDPNNVRGDLGKNRTLEEKIKNKIATDK